MFPDRELAREGAVVFTSFVHACLTGELKKQVVFLSRFNESVKMCS